MHLLKVSSLNICSGDYSAMDSGHRRPTVPPMYPHFFKIIVPHTIGSGNLMIPKMFVRKYGKTLSDSVVYLKVPNGRVWQIDVTRKDGEVSFNGRWTQFAEHYSLQLGYMLVFEHQGDSTFSVVIFDTSASEIEYPSCNIHGQEPTTTHNAKPCNEGDISDDSVQITRCQKRQQHNSIHETENIVNLRRSKRRRLDKEVHHPVPDVEAHRRWKTEILATINSAGKARALEKSVSFESNNPYFKIVMQPSYAQSYLGVPLEFAEKHLSHRYGDASLTTSDGRRWSVWYDHGTVRNNRKGARLFRGWKSFAKDNALEVGDVCVFELKDPTIISFQVVIFRLTTDKNEDVGSVADRAKLKGMKEPKMEANETNLNVKGNSKKPKCKAPISGRVVNLLSSCSEVPRALAEAKKFVSEHPCFLLFMSSGYPSRTAISVPMRFVNEYLTKSGKFVSTTSNPKKCGAWLALQVEDRLWNVNLVTCGLGSCKLSRGWLAFARGNNLGVGDACVFELISIPNFLFKVTIFKCL